MTVPVRDDLVGREARRWVIRLSEPSVGARDHAEFDAWLAGAPERAEAYRSALKAYSAAGDLKDRFAAEMRSYKRAPDRRPLWAGLGLAAAIAASLVVIVKPGVAPVSRPLRPDIATKIAEVRDVRLTDGTQVTLGAATALEVNFTARERRVTLGDGEAYFRVSHDPGRPFYVTARGTTVRVVGTQFEVKASSASVRVTVDRGVVQVAETPRYDLPIEPSGSRRLTAGEEVVVLPGAPIPLPVKSAGHPVASWREGFLDYDNAPLSEVVADANRYGRRAIQLGDPRLGDLRVTGSYPLNQLDQMLASLDAALPVDVDRQADGSVRLVRATP
jgi:transmembrane sensor